MNAYTLDLVQVMNPASISFDIRTEGILRFPTDGVFILSRTVKLNEVALLVVIYKMQNLVFFSDWRSVFMRGHHEHETNGRATQIFKKQN